MIGDEIRCWQALRIAFEDLVFDLIPFLQDLVQLDPFMEQAPVSSVQLLGVERMPIGGYRLIHHVAFILGTGRG